MSDFWSGLGIGIFILCVCFGLSYCHSESAKQERYEQQTKWLKEHPESYEKITQ